MNDAIVRTEQNEECSEVNRNVSLYTKTGNSSWNFSDLTGKNFNKLLVIKRVNNRCGKVIYECLCECGKIAFVASTKLRNGHTKSCGCLSTNRIRSLNKTHGMSGTPEWFAYWAANRRCSPNNKEKKADYYDRGIRFNFKSFEEFYKEVGPKLSDDYSLDRIDNNGNYEKGNVRWATKSDQIRNQRCNSCKNYKDRIAYLENLLIESGIVY